VDVLVALHPERTHDDRIGRVSVRSPGTSPDNPRRNNMSTEHVYETTMAPECAGCGQPATQIGDDGERYCDEHIGMSGTPTGTPIERPRARVGVDLADVVGVDQLPDGTFGVKMWNPDAWAPVLLSKHTSTGDADRVVADIARVLREWGWVR
jgi:hypothetical protein